MLLDGFVNKGGGEYMGLLSTDEINALSPRKGDYVVTQPYGVINLGKLLPTDQFLLVFDGKKWVVFSHDGHEVLVVNEFRSKGNAVRLPYNIVIDKSKAGSENFAFEIIAALSEHIVYLEAK